MIRSAGCPPFSPHSVPLADRLICRAMPDEPERPEGGPVGMPPYGSLVVHGTGLLDPLGAATARLQRPGQVTIGPEFEGRRAILVPNQSVLISLSEGTRGVLVSSAIPGATHGTTLRFYGMDGTVLRALDSRELQSPVLAVDRESQISMADCTGLLRKISPAGEPIWQVQIPRGRFFRADSIAVDDRRVALFTWPDGCLLFFDKKDGKPIGSGESIFEMGMAGIDNKITFFGDQIVVGCPSNDLALFSPEGRFLVSESLPTSPSGADFVGRIEAVTADNGTRQLFLSIDNRVLFYDGERRQWGELPIPDFPKDGSIRDLRVEEATGDLLVTYCHPSSWGSSDLSAAERFFIHFVILTREMRGHLARYSERPVAFLGP